MEYTYFELEGHITGQLSTQQYLESIWFVEDPLGEIEHLESYFAIQPLILEAFGKMHSNSWVFVPRCFEVRRNGSLVLH